MHPPGDGVTIATYLQSAFETNDVAVEAGLAANQPP